MFCFQKSLFLLNFYAKQQRVKLGNCCIIQEIELWQSSKHCNFCNLCSAMASRDGATVDGTDGSDFAHRERVVSQYYTR